MKLVYLFVVILLFSGTYKEKYVDLFSVPNYARVTDSVFHMGDLIQHEFEFRYVLGPQFATRSEKAGIQISDSMNYRRFLTLVDFIKTHPQLILEIGSHSDYRGSSKSNLEMTQFRADAIFQVLVQEYGIDSTQISAKGYGRDMSNTIYTCDGLFFRYFDDSIASRCNDKPMSIVLTNEYINSYKDDKVMFERLHQFNRRTELKVIGIR